MPNAVLSLTHVKSLSRDISRLSASGSKADLSALSSAWPKNSLHLFRRGEKSSGLEDRIVTLSARPGCGKTTLARMMCAGRPVVHTEGRVSRLPEIPPHGVLIADEILDPDLAQDLMSEFFSDRRVDDSTQMIIASQVDLSTAGPEPHISIPDRGPGADGISYTVTIDGKDRLGFLPTPDASHAWEKRNGLIFAKDPVAAPAQARHRVGLPGHELRMTPRAADMILSAMRSSLKNTESLDLVSRVAGFRNWHALQGALKNAGLT